MNMQPTNHYEKLAVIGVRLFAASLVLFGLIGLPYSIIGLIGFQSSESWLHLIIAFVYLVSGFVVYLFGKKLGIFISKNLD
jgi:hypothetical protein